MIKMPAKAALLPIALCLSVDVLLPVFSIQSTIPAQYLIPAMCLTLAFQIIITKLLLRCDIQRCLGVKLVRFTLSIFFLLSAAELFERMLTFYRATGAESIPTWIMLVLIIALFIVCVRFDTLAIARAGGIAIVLVVISVLIVIFANFCHADIGRISYLPFSFYDIVKTFASIAYLPIDIILYLLVCKDEAKERESSMLRLLCIITITAIVLCFMRELVLGVINTPSQSLHTLARLGGLSVFKRIESIHIFIWMVAALIKMSLFFILSIRLYADNKAFVFPLYCFLFVGALWVQTPISQVWIVRICGVVAAALICVYFYLIQIKPSKGGIQNEKVV